MLNRINLTIRKIHAHTVSMSAVSSIRLGSRVYLRLCIAGDPGCVVGFTRSGKAKVEWFDLDLGHTTEHDPSTLIVDEAFHVEQLGLDFEEIAA